MRVSRSVNQDVWLEFRYLPHHYIPKKGKTCGTSINLYYLAKLRSQTRMHICWVDIYWHAVKKSFFWGVESFKLLFQKSQTVTVPVCTLLQPNRWRDWVEAEGTLVEWDHWSFGLYPWNVWPDLLRSQKRHTIFAWVNNTFHVQLVIMLWVIC